MSEERGYCLRCKLIGVVMHDEFLCAGCLKELRDGAKK